MSRLILLVAAACFVTTSYAGVLLTKDLRGVIGPLEKNGEAVYLTVKNERANGRVKYRLSRIKWYNAEKKVNSYYKASRVAYKEKKFDVAKILIDMSINEENETRSKAKRFKLYMSELSSSAEIPTSELPESTGKSTTVSVTKPAPAADNFFVKSAGKDLIVYDKRIKKYDSSKLKDAKYVLIYSSASWCPPCRAFTKGQLMTTYQRLKQQYGDQFEVILWPRDRNDDAAEAYMKNYKMPWPAVKFQKMGKSPFSAFKSGGIPMLALIDKDGKQLSKGQGGTLQKLEQLLAQ